jgi:hypothetical protein
MEWNRDSVAAAIVGMGGAWMIGSALLGSRSSRMSYVQRRGLVLSGAGFLLTAFAARWLQGYGRIGIACSLGGTAVAMSGLYQLLKERAAQRDSAQRDSAMRDRSPREAGHREPGKFDSRE